MNAHQRILLTTIVLFTLIATSFSAAVAAVAHNYLWLEADEFDGIQLSKQVAVGMADPVAERTGWASRMGIFPDTTQGGGTRTLTLDAHPERADNVCTGQIDVPSPGTYRVWVRYGEWRKKTEPFKVKIEQQGRVALDHEFGTKPVVA